MELASFLEWMEANWLDALVTGIVGLASFIVQKSLHEGFALTVSEPCGRRSQWSRAQSVASDSRSRTG